jgi:formylglycine-generating enzyme required for sulfatase activity
MLRLSIIKCRHLGSARVMLNQSHATPAPRSPREIHEAILTLLVASLCECIPARASEQPLKSGQSSFFKDCATDCPEMVVIPAGSFTMGSPQAEPGRQLSEVLQHNVKIAKPFAVSKFEVTFAEWDACAALGDCIRQVDDRGWGRGRQPVISVSWDDAQRYVA